MLFLVGYDIPDDGTRTQVIEEWETGATEFSIPCCGRQDGVVLGQSSLGQISLK